MMNNYRLPRPLGVLALLALSACSGKVADIDRIAFENPDVFPESITSNADGDLYIGSAGDGSVYRVQRGEEVATVWISSEESGAMELLGVFADENSSTLYACSIAAGAPPEGADALSALYAFNLSTGATKAKYPLPGGAKALCNDIAVGASGTVYVSETMNGRVLRLTSGGAKLEVWAADERLRGVNGIAVGSDGALYMNTFTSGKFFRIPVQTDGAAGAISELAPSSPLNRPDGLRALGDMKFLQAEAGGRISEVEISSDQAIITPLKTGQGWSGVTSANGRIWAVNPKAEYRMDPSMADKDPNPFFIDAIDPAR
ncbi:Vgb family protein [Hyphococcus luteus]|uniref:SMP-30/Gluconolactonase/LRE-like region domain-containing protein n=1 Tax=Hyphococcus luteus TaxID=2058213 RepID=A0A2S7K590_9PROT|nr:hypothetical protein [Marinicaulis flavus]PQA87659.1 hypothetical protein CW354_11330 [Marinicaulis flavus]